MKFTIHGFSQDVAIKYNLKANDLLILRWFVDFKDAGNVSKTVIDGDIFYNIEYNYILECLPILDIKKQALTKGNIARLIDCNVLKRKIINEKGNLVYFALGENYKFLIDGNAFNYENKKVEEIAPKPSPKPKEEEKEPVDVIDSFNLSKPIKEKMNDWFLYKKEQHKFLYKEISKKTLLKQVIQYCDKFSENDVIKLIDTSIANGWKGIAWDILERGGTSGYRANTRNYKQKSEEFRLDESIQGSNEKPIKLKFRTLQLD